MVKCSIARQVNVSVLLGSSQAHAGTGLLGISFNFHTDQLISKFFIY